MSEQADTKLGLIEAKPALKNDEGAKVKGTIAKSAGVVAFFTTLSRIAGLARDMVTFHVFGASALTDAFFVAFTIPNMMRRFVAEGALTVAFIPVYTDVLRRDGEGQARQFLRATMGLLFLVLLGLIVVGMLGAFYLVYAFASGFAENPEQMRVATELTRWMFPYVFFVSFVALAMGVLNAHQHFAAPAASPVVLNLSMIACTLWFQNYFSEPIMALAAGVLIGGVLQLAIQIPVMRRMGLLCWPSFNFDLAPLKRFLRLMLPALFGVAVYQLNLIVLRQLGSYLPAGQISYYYNADRLMQLALGIFAISIATAALPTMSVQTSAGQKRELLDTWMYSTKLTNFITIPAALGLLAIAIPVVSVLYLHGRYSWVDVQWTAYTTMAFAPGLVAVAMSRTTAQAFYALEDMRTPVWTGAVCMVVNLVLGIALLPYEVVGLGVTLTLSGFVQTALLLWALRRKLGRIGGKNLLTSMLQQTGLSVVAVLFSVLIAWMGDWSRGPTVHNAAVLFLALVGAMGLYALLTVWFKLPEAESVWRVVKRRIKR